MRLFTNKCKQLSYINAQALNHVLRELPDLIDYHFKPKQNSFIQYLKNSLKRILYQNFLGQGVVFVRFHSYWGIGISFFEKIEMFQFMR